MTDCPLCDAGHKATKTLYVDFAKIRPSDLPRWIEAVRQADKVVFLNIEMGGADVQRLIASVGKK